MILVLDNYDSFTWNLVQYLGELGAEPSVVRNDQVSVEAAIALRPAAILVSPGPCTPSEAGISVPLVRAAAQAGIPLLGVCLVNNAGYAVTGAIEDIGDDEARRVLETMVIAPMRLARLALPAMRERGDGRIVNISSIAGLVSAPLAGWYTGSKHALEALSDSLRIEVARDGVKVVLVEPGGFKTGIWDEFERDIERFEEEGSRNADAYERMLGLQRVLERVMGEPEGCARVIADAVSSGSPRGRYLVGIDAQLLHASSRFTPPFVRDRVLRLVLGM